MGSLRRATGRNRWRGRRARQPPRPTASTLSGVALGEDDAAPQRDVLADVLEVFGGAPGLHWAELAARLAQRFPDRWEDTSADAVSAECRARGVPSVVVKAAGESGRGCRAADVEKAVSRS
jgi:DNA segregation ATPase FtsK/SpoIIIE, S-DNA-T family